MSDYPIANLAAASALGRALRDLGFSERAIEELLGEEDSSERDNATVADRRLPRTRLGDAVRALYFQLPIGLDDARRSLGPDAVAAAEAIGLVDASERFVARARIMPVEELLVASDDFPGQGRENPRDYVAAYTPTSRICDSLTVRRRIGRALDVGTGSGILALLSARHARQVVATDVNERALRFGELNAALNGLRNVEFRNGSLFEPVNGEMFDLITCNAPYVVSPENRWTYRDSGFQGDELSERLVGEAADHLAPGGFATLMASWLATDRDEPDERALAWTEATGCDGWILPVWGADAIAHAATWNEQLADEPGEFGPAIDAWLQYLQRLDAHWVTEGAIVLHRADETRATVRVDTLDEDDITDANEQIQRAFAARERLSELGDDGLAEQRLRVAAPLRLEIELDPSDDGPEEVDARLEIDEGTHSAVEGDEIVLDTIAWLDGSEPLEQAIVRAVEAADLPRAEAAELADDILEAARELLELGGLTFAD
jgi:methylase of polypeptide subunit release factors